MKTTKTRRAPGRKTAKAQPARGATGVYTADEVAALIGIHRAAVYEAAKAGRIPSRRPTPKRVIFPRAAIDRWLEGTDAPAERAKKAAR